MHREIQDEFQEIIRASGVRPKRALDVGGLAGARSLLNLPEVADAERICLNLLEQPNDGQIKHVVGNANRMRMFEDDSFDLVMSNATLEHDRFFWLSLAEMKRVLTPGGLLVIAVPGYVKNREELPDRHATTTFKVHGHMDYYRFSGKAVRDVFFAGMDEVRVRTVLTPPRIIGRGTKPPSVHGRVPGRRGRGRRAGRAGAAGE